MTNGLFLWEESQRHAGVVAWVPDLRSFFLTHKIKVHIPSKKRAKANRSSGGQLEESYVVRGWRGAGCGGMCNQLFWQLYPTKLWPWRFCFGSQTSCLFLAAVFFLAAHFSASSVGLLKRLSGKWALIPAMCLFIQLRRRMSRNTLRDMELVAEGL